MVRGENRWTEKVTASCFEKVDAGGTVGWIGESEPREQMIGIGSTADLEFGMRHDAQKP